MHKKKTEKYFKTKQLIDDTVKVLIDRIGLENITIEDICKEANITRSNFYYYYKNKNDMIIGRFEYMDKFFENEIKPLLTYSNIWEDIKTYINSYFIFVGELNLDYVKQMYIAEISQSDDRINSPTRFIHRILIDLLEHSKNREQLKCNPKDIYEIVLTVMRGMVFKWCFNNGIFNLAEEGKKEIDTIINGLKLYDEKIIL